MEFWIHSVLPFVVLGFFFLLGVIGIFLPIFPGIMMIWAGILVNKLWLGDESISWEFFKILTIIMVVGMVIDWILIFWGARSFGASWRGALGAIAGLVIGPIILTPIIGFIVGPIIGAIVGEVISGKGPGQAGKAGLGAILGNLVGFFVKLIIATLLIAGYFYNLYFGY